MNSPNDEHYHVLVKWNIKCEYINGVKVDYREQAVAALQKLARDVQKYEQGTLLYLVFTPDMQQKMLPTPSEYEVVFLEIYKNFQAFLDHVNGTYFQHFIKNYSGLFLNDFSNPSQLYMSTEVLQKQAGYARDGFAP